MALAEHCQSPAFSAVEVAGGYLNFRIANSRKLMLKLVGTGGKLTRQDLIEDGEGSIKNYFRSLIQLTVSTNLANIITDEKLDILQLDQQKMRLSASMLTALQASFEEYGLVITEFLIMGIMLLRRAILAMMRCRPFCRCARRI